HDRRDPPPIVALDAPHVARRRARHAPSSVERARDLVAVVGAREPIPDAVAVVVEIPRGARIGARFEDAPARPGARLAGAERHDLVGTVLTAGKQLVRP